MKAIIIKSAYDDIKSIDVITDVSATTLETISEKNKAILDAATTIRTPTLLGGLNDSNSLVSYVISENIWASSLTNVEGTINTDNLIEPTRAEKGARVLRSLNISDASINAINAVSLADTGTVIPPLLNFQAININDGSGNVRLARKAMLDILFGNDPSCVSFMTNKNDLGILLDSTDDIPNLRANVNYDLSNVRVYAPGPEVNIDLTNTVTENIGIYAALTQTGDEVRMTKYQNELHFTRQADGALVFANTACREL